MRDRRPPSLGYISAAEYGIALERLAIINWLGPQWQQVCAVLIEGFDIVVVHAPEPIPVGALQPFAARARKTGTIVLSIGHEWQ